MCDAFVRAMTGCAIRLKVADMKKPKFDAAACCIFVWYTMHEYVARMALFFAFERFLLTQCCFDEFVGQCE